MDIAPLLAALAKAGMRLSEIDSEERTTTRWLNDMCLALGRTRQRGAGLFVRQHRPDLDV
jgi:hypothetical protein